MNALKLNKLVQKATKEASEIAINSNIPIVTQLEDGNIWEVKKDGSKRLIKEILKPTIKLPKKFEL